jgi:hypothetical protein
MRGAPARAFLLIAASVAVAGTPLLAQAEDPADDVEVLERIWQGALERSRTYRFLEELSDSIGPRLTGSAEAREAAEWALRQMGDIGLKNVHLEHWQLQRGWRRGRATAELVSPYRLPLTVVSLGWAGSTKRGGVEAEVIRVDSVASDEELTRSAARWRGKIVLLERKEAKTDNFAAFTRLGALARAAHRARAVAVIRVSPRPGVMLAHTDPPAFSDEMFPIPILDMAPEHRKQLERLLEKRKEVRVRLNVENQFSAGPVQTSNVIGDIPGGEHPEQIVLLAAHLDSWELGTGAVDDGFGVASLLGAAEAILRFGKAPRRTIRVALFTGEEQGLLGSRAYVRAHQSEISDYLCSLAIDWGRGPVIGISVGGHEELIVPLERLMRAAHGSEPIKITPEYMHFTDSYSFTLAGVPGIAFAQEGRDYSMIGHSAADTLDKVDRDILIKTAALTAQTAFWIANHPTRLGTTWSAAETAQTLRKDKQQNLLESFGLWPFSRE